MILAGRFSDWWAYLAAPLAGGVVAVALYDRFLRAGRPPA
jgi:glycerol uptake facilitator-like aquaporin